MIRKFSEFLFLFQFSLVSIAAQAAVIDEFDCKIEFKGGAEFAPFQSEFLLRGGRQSTDSSTDPLVKFTETESYADVLTTNAKGGSFKIKTSFRYRHAVRTQPDGSGRNGALWRCVELTVETPEGSLPFECVAPTADPFDHANGNWAKTGFIENIPSFSVRYFMMHVTPPEGKIEFSCKYRKTYW